MNNQPVVLAIAGSDSGGGAGIQADIKSISANGGYACTAVTAVTVQNTQGVYGVHEVPPYIVAQQIECVLSDIKVDAIKIGMVASEQLINSIAECLNNYPEIPKVIDPVMVATSGDPLIQKEAMECLVSKLLPLASVLTPNMLEAKLLAGKDALSIQEMENTARIISKKCGGINVLIKGGDRQGNEAIDILYTASNNKYHQYCVPRIDSRNTHGTGCTYSSAIATYLASGADLSLAVEKSKKYISGAIEAGMNHELGKGHGPVHHFWNQQRIDK